MFLLDTNVVSELRKGDRADVNVRAWASRSSGSDMYISVVTVMELRMGILSKARQDPQQAVILEKWLTTGVLPAFEGKIFSIDVAVANQCAALHVPDPRSDRDALIAATALVHRLTVVTRNVRDFEPTGVLLVNPWE